MLTNKGCKEYIAGTFAFALILTCIVGTVVLCVGEKNKNSDLISAWIAGFIWMGILADFFAALVKAWLLWMANPKNFEAGASYWARVSMWCLVQFPILLPIDF